jgi:hypothetical protein
MSVRSEGPPAHPEAPALPDSDAVIARARVHLAIVWVVGIFTTCIGVGVLALMAVPLAHALAGRHTDFSFTVSISANVALGAGVAVSLSGLAIQTSRARHHKQRARELESKLAGQSTRQPPDPGHTSNGRST